MKKALLALAALASTMQAVHAQGVTWAQHIAPLMYTKCTSCHHPGGLAPFSLMNYQDAVDKKLMVVNATSSGEMPPWPPDPNYRHYKDERLLTNAQVNMINTWVSNGTPQGDMNTAPVPPVYTNGSVLPNVDLTVQIPTYTVPNINGDMYRCFTIPTNLLQDKYITGVEVIPGNPSIVHHVLMYEDTTGQSATLDANDAGPGYTSFGGPGFSADLIGGWVPGSRPNVYPAGMGVKLHKNSRIVLQIHYPDGSDNKTDSTKINFKLSTGNLRQIFINPPLNYGPNLVNGPLRIEPESVKTFQSRYTLPSNVPYLGVSLLDVAPHAHLICKSWLVFATTPQDDTIPLIKINSWDFHWQGFYQFQNLIKLEPGSKLHGFATYDNTSNNPHNPSSPPQLVTAGEATTDEMLLVYFSYLLYQPGDENLVIDSSTLLPQDTTGNDTTATGLYDIDDTKGLISTPQLYNASPNPANNQTDISYFLPQAANTELRIYDLTGKLVDAIKVPGNAGKSTITYNTSKLGVGTYLYTLHSGGTIKTKRLEVNR
ncbi:MAG: T9SS type A sorting domain-containing protein [Bacteroidetes bacterium]|nr:T9SS type A sorting domain-containing protein [Bacteroidota bacterium]